MDKYKFPCDPIADPASIVTGPQYRFTILSDFVARYEWAEDGVFEDRASTFAITRRFPTPQFTVTESGDELTISTPSFHLTYDKKRFSANGLHVSFRAKTSLWGAEWRYGAEADDTNLGGTARTLDNVDGRCDMGLGIISRSGYACIDDSDSMLFDGHGFVAPRRPGHRVDGYLFSYGFDFQGAMKAYYAVSGSQPQVPRWALGNWWSRYHAYTQKEYLDLVDDFSEEGIPLSVGVVDMDWHIVKGDNVPHSGWTGYTWNKELFPDPDAFGKALRNRKLKMTLNDHPHAGIASHEDVYEKVAKHLGHDTTNKAPILFNPTSPKFMDAYLNILHRDLEKNCDFWWIDWQQGSSSAIPGIDPLWVLNHFHYLDNAQLENGDKPLIFSRYAGPGSHRYPVGFSGDSINTWDSLRFQPEFTATASNIGYGWWSHDIGGHMGGYRDDELATRWVQFGVFSPILRLHSSHSPWTSKEPWNFRQEFHRVMVGAMRLRHRLIPYIYTENVTRVLPLVQPLYWRFPEREEAYQKPNEYFFGSSLVVAPVVHPRDQRTHRAAVDVWVPPSRHVDLFTGFVYDGDREITLYRTINQIPLLAPQGSIVPIAQELRPENGSSNPSGLNPLVVVGKDGEFTVVEDEHDDLDRTAPINSIREIKIEYNQAAGKLTFPASNKSWKIKFASLFQDPTSVSVIVDGSKIEAKVTNEERAITPGLSIEIPKTSREGAVVVISLGPNPQLSITDPTARIKALLLDYQVNFSIKDQIWAICQSSRPTTVKVGMLTGLGLDKEVLGPVLELMVADSRLI
ncbi:putative alpha-xylosidase [Dactylonectria estremocensis]|uniref:alpha-glucosidase n=1 Tax=Dactylonectria estremocensis TaxID=1079267 RepID=A0A9P9DWK7_9HYPO|nr:putative alpha-xylosidase [Dactylonectria estremocensis]